MCGPEVISVVSLKKISHKTKTRDMIYLEKLKKITGILTLMNVFISPIFSMGEIFTSL